MPTLILMRHSKAVNHSADDHGRALSERGRAEAAEAGLALLRLARPDYALVSDAVRTRETFEAVQKVLAAPVTHRVSARLYAASPATILSEVATAPTEARRLLVVGHNPGLADLARTLAGSGESEALASLGAHFPTSAFAVLALDGESWSGLGAPGRLESVYERDEA